MGRTIFTPVERIISFPIEGSGEAGAPVIDKDDLKLSVKKKIGEFVSDLTKAGKNISIVTPTYQDDQHLTDPLGYPEGLSNPENGYVDETSIQRLVREGNTKSKVIFEKTSNTGMLDLPNNEFRIKKGKSSSPDKSGEQIYAEVEGLGNNAPIVRRIGEVLKENNRFNDENPFFDSSKSNSSTNKEDNIPVSYVQRQFGKHAPRRFPDQTDSPNPQTDTISINELKKVGLLTMLEASGELVSPSNPDGTEFLTNLAPSLTRLGQRIPVSRFNAVNAYQKANPAFEKPSSTVFIENDGNLSYGNVNNYAATFSGFASGPSMAAAALLMVTVGGLLKALSLVLKKIKTPARNGGSAPTNDNRKKRLGSFKIKEDPSTVEAILDSVGIDVDIVDTNFQYFECLNTGINVFFGIEDASSGVLGGITSTVSVITKLHGYYNVILRNIIRDITSIVAPDGIVQNNGSSDLEIEALAQYNPFTLIEKINNSKLLKFMNILATIGDVVLLSEQNNKNKLVDSNGGLYSIIDLINEYDGGGINPSINISKNRLEDGTLAWKQNALKSLYILPPNFQSAVSRYDTEKLDDVINSFGQVSDTTRIKSQGTNVVALLNESLTINGNRIKQEIVKDMEDYLEKDYLPFYFHDLRTNEIISFNAFIDSVTDAYTAEYIESEGFGRMDKVHTYKATTRDIAITFKLVALDEEDFDQMWVKVNKFVTLVYPQWSKGREISWGSNKMIQPFSQHPSASPMVRMRLGDFIKTNYSNFALSRLFGISSQASEFKLEKLTQQDGDVSTDTQRRRVQGINQENARRRQGTYSTGQILLVKAGTYHLDASVLPSVPRPRTPVQPTRNHRRRISPTIPNTVVIQGNRIRARVLEDTNENITGNFKVVLVNGEEGTFSPDNSTTPFFVPYASIAIDDQDVRRTVNNSLGNPEETTNTQQEDIEAFNAFKDETKNPIFKSFASTKGRGLAGFIKSLSLSLEQTTWETKTFNGRAPKMLTISIAFTPIHDIVPGIDHNGFNTAPLYNVGNSMQVFSFENNALFSQEQRKFNQNRPSLPF